MGHERNAFLPQSAQWRKLVADISGFGANPDVVHDLASRTAIHVRQRLHALESDGGFQAAFDFLLALCSQRLGERVVADKPNVDLKSNPSPLEIARQLNSWVDANQDSLEYAELAKRSAADAIAYWTVRASQQQKLFDSHTKVQDTWDAANKGAAFSEISRVFFGKFLERYLKYFLEREASAQFPTIDTRERFGARLTEHAGSIARHAFEASRITQSFAAGWYNKNARRGPIDRQARRGFLSFALAKLRQELQREASG